MEIYFVIILQVYTLGSDYRDKEIEVEESRDYPSQRTIKKHLQIHKPKYARVEKRYRLLEESDEE